MIEAKDIVVKTIQSVTNPENARSIKYVHGWIPHYQFMFPSLSKYAHVGTDGVDNVLNTNSNDIKRARKPHKLDTE